MTTEIIPRLTRLGDVLEQAAAADLIRAGSAARRPRSRRPPLFAATIAALLGAGAAIAAGVPKTADEEERGMLGGTYLFSGSNPSCEALSSTSFRCTLDRPPTGMTFYDENMRQSSTPSSASSG